MPFLRFAINPAVSVSFSRPAPALRFIGQPHPERTTEIDPLNTQCLGGSQGVGISVEGTLSTPDGPSSADFQDVPSPPPTRRTQGTEEDL